MLNAVCLIRIDNVFIFKVNLNDAFSFRVFLPLHELKKPNKEVRNRVLPFIDNEVEAGFHKNPFANDPVEKPGEQ